MDEQMHQIFNKMLDSVKSDPDLDIDLNGLKLKGKAFVCAVLVNDGQGTQVVVKGRTGMTRLMAWQLNRELENQAEQNSPRPFAHLPMVN